MSCCSCEIVVTDEVADCTIIFTSMSWNRRQSAGCSYRSRWRSGRARARTPQATRPHVGISRATFGPRPCAIPQWCAAGGHERHEAGGAGAVGRAERSDGDGNVRQVSGCRHVGWREMPSVSMRSRHGVRRQPRHAAGPCGPPSTPLAGVVNIAVEAKLPQPRRIDDGRWGRTLVSVFMEAPHGRMIGKVHEGTATGRLPDPPSTLPSAKGMER